MPSRSEKAVRAVRRNGSPPARKRRRPARARTFEDLSLALKVVEQQRQNLIAAQDELEASRDQYVELYNTAPVGYLTLSRGGVIRGANETAVELLHRRVKGLMQAPLSVFIVAADHRKLLSHLSACHQRHARGSVDLQLRTTAEEGERFIEMVTVPTYGLSQEFISFKSTVTEITERKRAEAAAKRAHAELEGRIAEQTTLMKLLPIGVLIGDAECQKISGNPAAYEILGVEPGGNLALGVPPEEALKGVHCRVDGEEVDSLDDMPMQRVARTGRPLNNIKQDIIYSDGRRTTLHASIAPLFNEAGGVRSVIGAYADITKRDQAEQSIRSTESQLRLVTDIAPVMLIQCTQDLRYQYCNRAYAEFLGKQPEDIIGQLIRDVIGAAALAQVMPYINKVLRGERVEFEQPITCSGTESRHVRMAFAPDQDERGNVMGWVGALLNVTEQRQHEKRVTANLAVTQLLSESLALADAMPKILAIVGTSLGWQAASFLTMDAKEKRLCHQLFWHLPNTPFKRFEAISRNTKFALGKGLPGIIWKTRKALWIPNVAKDRRFVRRGRVAAEEGLCTAAGFPILFGKKLLGVMEFFSERCLPVDEDVVNLLGNFGIQIGQFIERKRAELELLKAHDELEARVKHRTSQLTRTNAALIAEAEERRKIESALRDSEERFRLMIEGVQDCDIFMLDPQGRIATWNEAARRLHGYRKEDVLGRNFSCFFPREDVRAGVPKQILARTIKEGRAEHQGWRVRKNGTRFWASVFMTALRDEAGTLRGVSKVTRDFTERHRSELALEESRARLQAIMDNSSATIFLKDNQGRYLHCNRRFEEIFHLPLQKVVGKTDLEIFPPLQARKFRANDRAVRKAGRPLMFDEVARHDGELHTSIVTKFPLHDARGKIYAIGGVATDVTDRLRAREALRRNEEIMTDFFEQAPLGLFWINSKGLITRVNKMGLEVLGCAPAQCLNRPLSDFLIDQPALEEARARLARREELQNYRARLRTRHRELRHVLIDANGFWQGRTMQHSRWFIRDITRRVELEREILAASEHERQRIGRDLHDDLCQQLAGIEFLSQSLARQIPGGLPDQSGRAKEIARMLREAMTHTRELAHGLSPTPLDSKGLQGALRELSDRAHKLFKVNCHLECKQSIVLNDEAVTFHLYRIAQEAVNNAIKHGRARRIEIELSRRQGTLALKVSDFGVGMKSARKDDTGMGLRVMRYRAGVIGGALSIGETPGGGTTVICTLPEYLLKSERSSS